MLTGSGRILPLGMMIARSESSANIAHLLQRILDCGLHSVVMDRLDHEPKVLVIADEGTALKKGIKDALGDAVQQRSCLLHLIRGLQGLLGGPASKIPCAMFWAAAQAPTKRLCDA